MLIRIEHVSRYRFEAPTSYSIQSLRLTPASFAGQTVHSWQVTSRPQGTMTETYDGFGNHMHLLVIEGAHPEIAVVASGLVEADDSAGIVRGLAEPAPPRVFLRRTKLTQADRAITSLAASIPETDPTARLHALMAAIGERVAYEPGATDAATSAAEALAAGKGVCQDHAHIFIAVARELGIPARYVTGYLHTGSTEASGAHHAWAEALVEGLGWVGFDAANGICPTDHYVRLAGSLDASYAAPIRGSRLGGISETLEVSVMVQQQQNMQQ